MALPGTWEDNRQELRSRNMGCIINKQGQILHPLIRQHKIARLEHGLMAQIDGIVVHQTGGKTLQSAFDQAPRRGVGTHFYIDKDGTIYQTVSIYKSCSHIDKLRPRCITENSCTKEEKNRIAKLSPMKAHKEELKKPVPQRYPYNTDSVGIEMVGFYSGAKDGGPGTIYDPLTPQQQKSLTWLLHTLCVNFNIKPSEIFRHPKISFKCETEAAKADISCSPGTAA